MNESVKMAAAAQAANDGAGKRISPSPVAEYITDDDTAVKKQRANGENGNGTSGATDDDANEVAKSLDRALDI